MARISRIDRAAAPPDFAFVKMLAQLAPAAFKGRALSRFARDVNEQ
jgi:hypothetical protein